MTIQTIFDFFFLFLICDWNLQVGIPVETEKFETGNCPAYQWKNKYQWNNYFDIRSLLFWSAVLTE